MYKDQERQTDCCIQPLTLPVTSANFTQKINYSTYEMLNVSIIQIVIKFMHRQFRGFLHDHSSIAFLNGNRQLLPPAITEIIFIDFTTGIL